MNLSYTYNLHRVGVRYQYGMKDDVDSEYYTVEHESYRRTIDDKIDRPMIENEHTAIESDIR